MNINYNLVLVVILFCCCAQSGANNSNILLEKPKFDYSKIQWVSMIDNSSIEAENDDGFEYTEEFEVFLLPDSICIVDFSIQFNFEPRFKLESGKWNLVGDNLIQINTASFDFQIKINDSSKLGYNSKVLKDKAVFDSKHSFISKERVLLSNNLFWKELNGNWNSVENNSNCTDLLFDQKASQTFFTLLCADNTASDYLLYYLIDDDLIILNSRRIFKMEIYKEDATDKNTIILRLMDKEDLISYEFSQS